MCAFVVEAGVGEVLVDIVSVTSSADPVLLPTHTIHAVHTELHTSQHARLSFSMAARATEVSEVCAPVAVLAPLFSF